MLVEEVWFLTKSGNPIINYSMESKLSDTLFSKFISAMKSFTKESTNKELKSFCLTDKKFFCDTCLDDSIILVCRTQLDVKDKKVIKILNVVKEYFEEMYTISDIQNWDGNISFFDDYKNKLDLYFKMSQL